jgi:hypothetical protein
MPPQPGADAGFATDDALAGQVAAPPEPESPAKGGLFGKLMGRKATPPPPPPPEIAPPTDASLEMGQKASIGQEASFGQDASFDAGYSEGEQQDATLADPDLVAAAFGESAKKEKKRKKDLPIVAIGWGILALIVLVVVGLFAFAPATTVSMLPGASRVYAMLGMPVGAQGLEFDGVRYGWTNDGSQTVLEVQGNVRNTSSAAISVPTVVIALRDENGDEISEWQTEVGAAELAAGEEAPFLKQIPSPPSNVRSLKVRFSKAN